MTIYEILLVCAGVYLCWRFFRHRFAASEQIAPSPNNDLAVMHGMARKIVDRSEGWEALPVVESNFELEPGEAAHLEAPASLVALQTTKSTTGYHGLAVRIPIAKGVSYRLGAINHDTESQEDWRVVDEGGVSVTNRRIIFHGLRGNTSVRLSKIIRTYGAEEEMVRLDKDTGKPFIVYSPYALVITAMIQRLLADRRDGHESEHVFIDKLVKSAS